tara:strand:- start:545 stop:820 length:276 start_codon:yes stop_codon:yes gene_type:complete
VLQYKPEPVRAAFDVVEDGFTMEDAGGSAFTAVSNDTFEEPAVNPAPSDPFADEEPEELEVVEEPKKAVKKSKPAKSEKEAIASVLDDWDD